MFLSGGQCLVDYRDSGALDSGIVASFAQQVSCALASVADLLEGERKI